MPIAADDQISPRVPYVHLRAGGVVRATPLRPVREGSCRNIGQCGTSGPIIPVPARQDAEDIEDIAVGSVKNLGHPEMHADPSDKNRPPSEPSQGLAPRGKTPAPGSTHVRSAQQGISPGS